MTTVNGPSGHKGIVIRGGAGGGGGSSSMISINTSNGSTTVTFEGGGIAGGGGNAPIPQMAIPSAPPYPDDWFTDDEWRLKVAYDMRLVEHKIVRGDDSQYWLGDENVTVLMAVIIEKSWRWHMQAKLEGGLVRMDTVLKDMDRWKRDVPTGFWNQIKLWLKSRLGVL